MQGKKDKSKVQLRTASGPASPEHRPEFKREKSESMPNAVNTLQSVLIPPAFIISQPLPPKKPLCAQQAMTVLTEPIGA